MSENTGEPQRPEDQPPAYPPPPPTYPPPGVPGPTNPYATPYAAQPGYPPPPYQGVPGFPSYVLPDLPKATTALVLGLISVAGAFFCVLPIVVSPFAWVVGAQARKEIRNAPNHWGGEGKATAGMVLGIIGTVLLALGLVAIVLFVIFAIATNGGSGSSGTGV